MNRTLYWISHIILAIIVVAGLVVANLVNEITEEDPTLKDEYTSFWIWFFGISGLLALIWWFGVVRGRMQNMGFDSWICWLWSVLALFVPIPGVRLIPWVAGFFVPPDTF